MHAMHEIQPIVTGEWCLSVSLSVTRPNSASLCKQKTAEQIKTLFGVNTPGGSWDNVLHQDSDPPQTGRGTHFYILGPPISSESLEILRAYRGVEALTKTMQQ